MEKFGVDESVDENLLEKVANEGCPDCGGPVRREGNLMFCKRCGTEPFEKVKKENGGKEKG